jgi:transposase
MVIPSTVSAPPPPAAAAKPRPAHAKKKARAHAKAEGLRQQQAAKVAALPVSNPHAAGIDIGDRSHWVCVGFTSDETSDLVREFRSNTVDLRQIIAYLRGHGVTTVALEATGIYWVPLFEMLQAEGWHVILVDPAFTAQVRGRPKTDRRDAQWIFRLHACGLLPAAFRPDEQTVVLRSYLRQRGLLTRYAGRHVQHMQKALQQMNVKLTSVLSDITGLTGRKILTAILAGERDPLKLAQLRTGRCKATVEDMAKALDGNYRDEHLFALKQAFEAWQFYIQQIQAVDQQIQAQLLRMKANQQWPQLPARPPRRRLPGDPDFDVRTALYLVVGVDLTELEGLDEISALILISEIGTDMSKFATVQHFCSWLGLCPNFKKSGGKVKSSRSRRGKNRAAQILRVVVMGLDRGNGALGAFLRRLKSRLGMAGAVTATAHKLARQVYYALKHGTQYVKKSQQDYEKQLREKQIACLRKKARQLGFELKEKVASSEQDRTAASSKAEAAQPAEPARGAKPVKTAKTAKAAKTASGGGKAKKTGPARASKKAKAP